MDYREEYERKTGESVIELIGKVENHVMTVFMIDPEPQLEIKKFKNKYVKFLEQQLQEKDKVIEELKDKIDLKENIISAYNQDYIKLKKKIQKYIDRCGIID